MSFDEEVLKYNVSRETLQKLKDFKVQLLEWNQKINLVSKNAENELDFRHILDSLQLLEHIDNNAKLIIDIGSGSGFPGIVLAIVLQEKIPEARIVLVESITKKTVYLKDVCGCLGLTNVEVVNNRAENIVFKNADYITARAVATIDKIYNFTKTIYSKNTRYLLLKGKSGNDELQEARKKWTFEVNSFANKYCADGYLYEIFDLRKIK